VNRTHLLLVLLLGMLAGIAASMWVADADEVERELLAAGPGGAPASSKATFALDDSSVGDLLASSAATPDVPSCDEGDSPLPKIEHAWDSIGGLCTPDMYPEVAEQVASPVFNPRGKQLDQVKLAELTQLREELRVRLEDSRLTAMLRMSDSVTQMIEFGETLGEGEQADTREPG
jgi:hypothetical protein